MTPVLHTERLLLRLPEAGDLDAWADFSADPQTMAHLGGTRSRAESWRALCTMRGAWDIRGFAMFSVVERDTGRWVGRIGPWHPEGWPGREVGWGVAREFAGRGYAFEAACACMDFAFDTLGWDRVIHTIDPDNARSITLAKRLGSVDQGPCTLPPPFADLPVRAWGQGAKDWRARRM
ncbi:GNAT family N-acetyltransferase [Stakelama sp. CBK3Z-3]|uniref:GNAT family N-acetyltransferase n=1 Tax=Stakelama flava TaxID=2860338 RepID=A0ABS6XRC8_9SPHN|nr:GNAT family N-acetyltransferase [Stakelama flava]MBW4331965.1 GNAT family N-acetyltransferase [Stakelama flava]